MDGQRQEDRFQGRMENRRKLRRRQRVQALLFFIGMLLLVGVSGGVELDSFSVFQGYLLGGLALLCALSSLRPLKGTHAPRRARSPLGERKPAASHQAA